MSDNPYSKVEDLDLNAKEQSTLVDIVCEDKNNSTTKLLDETKKQLVRMSAINPKATLNPRATLSPDMKAA